MRILTEQSIGKLFIAGIVPGLHDRRLFCVVIYSSASAGPSWGRRAPPTTWGAKFALAARRVSETLCCSCW